MKESQESKQEERPLSPVLSTGKKSSFSRVGKRLKKTTSRTNLSKRFAQNEPTGNTVTRETMCLYFSNLPDPGDTPEVRLKKLRGMEEKRQEYLKYLTDIHIEDERLFIARDTCEDRMFKKPMSPVVLRAKKECSSSQENNSRNQSETVEVLPQAKFQEEPRPHRTQPNYSAEETESAVSKESAKADGERFDDNQEGSTYFKYVSQFLEDLKKGKNQVNETNRVRRAQAINDISLHCKNILELINLVDRSFGSSTELEHESPIFSGFAPNCITSSQQKANFGNQLLRAYEKQTKEFFKDITEEEIDLSIHCVKKPLEEQGHIKITENNSGTSYNDDFVTLYENEKRTADTTPTLCPQKRFKQDSGFDKQRQTEEWHSSCFARGDFKKDSHAASTVTNSENTSDVGDETFHFATDKSVCHSPGFGFKCASGKDVKKIPHAALAKAARVFDEILEEVRSDDGQNLETVHLNSGFSNDDECINSANGGNSKVESALQVHSAPTVSFAWASGRSSAVSKLALANAQRIFEGTEADVAKPEAPAMGFVNSARKADAEKTPKDTEAGCTTCKTPANEEKHVPRKHLGSLSHRAKQIPVQQRSLESARKLFDDVNKFCTPVKQTSSCHTPKTEHFNSPYVSTPVCNSSPVFFDRLICDARTIDDKGPSSDAARLNIVLRKETIGDVDMWLEELKEEEKRLQQQLRVLNLKQQALHKQKLSLQTETSKKPVAGILFTKKQGNDRKTLRLFVGGLKPGEQYSTCLGSNIFSVTPNNAVLVHFTWNSGTLETLDGAHVVPNKLNLIGISEIKAAFQTMPGVQASLIPSKWTANHYKWIIWKLASMERAFPNHFKNCLTIENVMQQLKYRYDREIDRAERPALRKILEKDDSSQKRMVLCVSGINKCTGELFELELTDGWYSVRTLVDGPLGEQIKRQKLKLGTKIVTQGAALANCDDGCHPLEAPANVYLKINYNCTRRAAWDAKLGFQSIPGPLLISLKSVNFKGGNVGCIKVYLARVYPLRYMEKQGSAVVWRNAKAEEKRAKAFAAEQLKRVEDIQHKIQRSYRIEREDSQRERKPPNSKESDVPSLVSGEELHNVLAHSSDQEKFMEKLTPSQLASLECYRRRHFAEVEQELAARIRDELKKSQMVERDVVPILKLSIIDASDCSESNAVLNIWKPTDELLHMLKEGRVFSIFNTTPKNNGILGSSCRTRFKEHTISVTRFKKFARQIVPIGAAMQALCKPFLNEFDTVGIVVKIRMGPTNQDLWLTDQAGRLLLVKVSDSPERCSIIDNLERGQIVTVSNLILCEPQSTFGFAMGNQHTTVAKYPKNRLLMEALDVFKQQIPQDIGPLLHECERKIDICVTKLGFISSLQNKSYSETLLAQTTSLNISDILTDSSEEEGRLPAKLTALDVAMSMIDMDKLTT